MELIFFNSWHFSCPWRHLPIAGLAMATLLWLEPSIYSIADKLRWCESSPAMGDLWISTVESWQKLVLLSMFQTSEVPNTFVRRPHMPEAQSKLENLGSFVFRFPDVSCVSRGCSLTRKDSSERFAFIGGLQLFFKAWWTAEGLYHSGLDANSRKKNYMIC